MGGEEAQEAASASGVRRTRGQHMTSARQPENRILLIAYHFPPSAAVGGLRAANFARCLRAFGWEPRVLTIRETDVEQIDRSRERGVESIKVYRTAVWPTIE